MAVFPKSRPGFRRATTDDAGPSVPLDSTLAENRKDPAVVSATDATASNDNDEPPSELPSEDVQGGVQNIEAVTLTWSKKSLVAVFILYDLAFIGGQPVCVSN